MCFWCGCRKIMRGGGQIKFTTIFRRVLAKLFLANFPVSKFLVLSLSRSRRSIATGVGNDRFGVKVLGKCLSRLETSRATPPLYLQLNFLLRLTLGENWL